MRSIQSWISEHQATHFMPMDDKFWGLAICGEAGELANMLKKEARGTHCFSVSEIGEELADIFIYMAIFASRRGVDLEEAVRGKMAEVDRRIVDGYYGPAQLTREPVPLPSEGEE